MHDVGLWPTEFDRRSIECIIELIVLETSNV